VSEAIEMVLEGRFSWVWMTRDAFLEFFVFNDKPIIEIDRQPQQQHHYHLRLRDDDNNGWWR
jgi:hypothetical protein